MIGNALGEVEAIRREQVSEFRFQDSFASLRIHVGEPRSGARM